MDFKFIGIYDRMNLLCDVCMFVFEHDSKLKVAIIYYSDKVSFQRQMDLLELC